MSQVTLYFNQIEGKVWHHLETFSQNHPKTAKGLLPLPVAIGHIAKSSLINPLKAGEHLIGIGKEGYRLCRESDPKIAFWINNSMQSHILSFAISLFSSLIYPPFAFIQAIYLSITIFINPIKSTKILAAKQDLIAFLDEERLRPSKSYTNGKLETFACNYKYAKHAYKHFRKRVLDSKDKDVPQLHFCDTLESRNLLVTEMNQKTLNFDKYSKIRIENYPHVDTKLREDYLKKWIKFQRDLLNANLDNLHSVSFDPIEASK